MSSNVLFFLQLKDIQITVIEESKTPKYSHLKRKNQIIFTFLIEKKTQTNYSVMHYENSW